MWGGYSNELKYVCVCVCI